MSELPSERATKIVKERQSGSHYGHPIHSHTKTAALWQAYLGVRVTKFDVAQMLLLHKVSREKVNPHQVEDNIDDQAGYANVYRMMEERNNDDV